nr:hypothetical protein [Corynebacterium ulcerans]
MGVLVAVGAPSGNALPSDGYFDTANVPGEIKVNQGDQIHPENSRYGHSYCTAGYVDVENGRVWLADIVEQTGPRYMTSINGK